MDASLHTVLRNIKQLIDHAVKLINKGADVNAVDDEGETPLHLAIKIDNAVIVELLIEKGADVQTNDQFMGTPLHVAAELSTNVEILNLLISAGADVNANARLGVTPLHCSVENENRKICKYLINAGAAVNAKDWNGRTPLYYSVKNENTEICKYLISEGADVNASDYDDESPLHCSVFYPSRKICKMLIRAGAEVNAKNYFGETPLHRLFELNPVRVDILKCLIEAGADVTEENNYGKTPLEVYLAFDYPQIENLKLFQDAGYNVNDVYDTGHTCLTLLIMDAMDAEGIDKNDMVLKRKTLKFLIAYCDINLVNAEGQNILANVLEDISTSTIEDYPYKIVLEHMAKLKVLNLHIDAKLLNAVKKHYAYCKYFKECVQELEKAKSTKLDKCWVSFFNLLVDTEEKLVKYAGNGNLVNDLKRRVKDFKIYGTEMQNNMSEATEHRKLFNEAAKTLSYCCPIFDPYHLIIYDVLNVVGKEFREVLSKIKRKC